MLTSLKLTGFRGFPSLELRELTRVNLLVGANNAGKSSVLEAAELLLSGGSPLAVQRIAARRGESFFVKDGRREVDVSHLFHGHPYQREASFSLVGEGVEPSLVRCELVRVDEQLDSDGGQPDLFRPEPDREEVPLALRVTGRRRITIPLAPGSDWRRWARGARGDAGGEESGPSVLTVDPRGDDGSSVVALWDRVVLTPEEPNVVSALQLIEPGIERVAALSGVGPYRSTTSDVYIRLAGFEQRLPLGSMGDGVKRLFVLAVHLVNAQGGFLLVDEIDTGLHHGVMVKMWRMVIETARRLGVQVFATTHSQDCLQALAQVAEQWPELAGEVASYRIERGIERGVRFTPEEIGVAARRSFELR